MRNKREVPEHIKAKVQDVGNNICKLRTEKGLTREKLAYGIDIAKSYLGCIERGQANPTLETLLMIAEVLNLPIEFIKLVPLIICRILIYLIICNNMVT